MDSHIANVDLQQMAPPPLHRRLGEGVADPIELWSFPGVVVSIDRWTETVTASAGGLISIGEHGSFTVPPAVSTSSQVNQRLWLQVGDEKQVSVPAGENVAVAIGHKVTVIVARNTKTGDQVMHGIVNHTSGTSSLNGHLYEVGSARYSFLQRWMGRVTDVCGANINFGMFVLCGIEALVIAIPVKLLLFPTPSVPQYYNQPPSFLGIFGFFAVVTWIVQMVALLRRGLKFRKAEKRYAAFIQEAGNELVRGGPRFELVASK